MTMDMGTIRYFGGETPWKMDAWKMEKGSGK
jgi:hypothetical protein